MRTCPRGRKFPYRKSALPQVLFVWEQPRRRWLQILFQTRYEMNPAHSRTILLTALLSIFFLPVAANAQIDWAESFDAALKQAGAEGKYIFLDISASW